MAGLGWNFAPIPKRPSSSSPSNTSSQIACRICNRVFINTKALINHAETHLEPDDSVSTRLSDDQNRISSQKNPFNPNPPSSAFSAPPNFLTSGQNTHNLPSVQEIRNNPMLCGRPNIASPRPVIPLQPPLSLLANRNINYPSGGSQPQVSAPLSQSISAMEDHPYSDGPTKPLIQQLEKPYFYKTELMDGEISDVRMLDLTLKL